MNIRTMTSNDGDSQFHKLSQSSFNLKDKLTAAAGLKDEDIDDILEQHITTNYTENQPICDFVQGVDWLNVAEPLSLETHLKNKVVVLDFWTYCCINCLHMLPELKRIEEKYSEDENVVFVGVHSAKFDHERITQNVKDAALRHKITHPVINDYGAMWSALGISCWPTILILGPNSRPLYVQIGEGDLDVLDKYLKHAVKFFKNQFEKSGHSKVLYTQPAQLANSKQLSYPGKVACYKTKDYSLLAVSDSANNRVLVIKNYKDVINVIGGSQKGYKDGDVGTALFANPQGVAFYNENIIFVADCENHCIRKVDLQQKKVFTAAGPTVRHINKDDECEIEFQMRSPWGLSMYTVSDASNEEKKTKSVLFIAMAGTHQIWALFLDTFQWWKNKKYMEGSCSILSGTGKEENRNNIYPMSASFAQPSGLSINYEANEMYVADSESSTIRKICLNTGKVSLIVGGEKDPYNLFAYGDLDGSGVNAKLKHPMDVAWSSANQCVFVVDTFNNRIRVVDVKTNTIKSIWQEVSIKEPGGVCLSPDEDFLVVANTNNHTIEMINIKHGIKNTLNLNFEALQRKAAASRNVMTPESIFQKTVFLANRKQVVICVRFIESTIKLNREVKQNWRVRNDDNRNALKRKEVCDNMFRVVFEFNDDSVSDHIYMNFRLALCTGEICFMKIFALDYDVVRDKHKSVCYQNLTENTLVTIENNEMKVLSSIATFA